MIEQRLEAKKSYATVTTIFVILILTVTVTSFYYYRQTKTNLMTEKFTEVKAVSGQKAERVSNWIDERKAEGKYLATNSVLLESIDGDSFDLTKSNRHAITELFEQLRSNHSYSTISLLDLNGNLILATVDSTRPSEVSYPIVGVDTIKTATISMENLSESIPCITILTPVFNKMNKRAGFVFQKIDIRTDADLIFENIALENDPYLMELYYFKEGKVYALLDSVATDAEKATASEQGLPSEMIELGIHDKSGLIQVEGFNDKFLLGYLQKLGKHDLFVYCGMKPDQLEQPLKPIFLLLTIIIVITIALSALAIALVIKRQEVSFSKKIADSEVFLESIREGMSDGFAVFDYDFKFTALNTNAIKMLGKSRSEIIGKSAYEVLPHIENSDFRLAFQEVKETGKPIESVSYYTKWDVYYQNKLFPVKGGIAVFFFDITTETKLKEQIREAYEQLERLTLHMQVVAENDREAIAREIHDELGQVLTSLKMNLAMMRNSLKSEDTVIDKSFLLEEINTMAKQIDATVKRIRRIITELRPEVLDHLGFIAAIEWLVEESPAKNLINYKFSSNVEHLELEKNTATALFRIVQEACTNINRHSEAKNATISVEYQDDTLILSISDDGKGFFVNDLKGVSTFGLLGMRERAKLVKAELNIKSKENSGTTIIINVSLKK